MFCKKFFPLGLISITVWMFASLAWGQEQVGQLEVEKGEALIVRGAESEKVEAGDTVSVFPQDVLQTLNNSEATVTLGNEEDSDLFTLGEQTTFKVEEYVQNDEKPTRGLFSLLGGKVRSFIKHVSGKKDITIQTSTATIGVKGTDFLTEVPNSNVTQVTTFDGVVTLKNRLDDVLKEVTLTRGFSSLVLASSAPSSPFALSRESLFEASQVVGRVSESPGAESNLSQLIRNSTSAGFQKSQFDSIVEDAARAEGSLVRVKVIFH